MLKQLRETQGIEHYKNIGTNFQDMFPLPDQIFEAIYAQCDQIFEKQHEESNKIGNELVILKS